MQGVRDQRPAPYGRQGERRTPKYEDTVGSRTKSVDRERQRCKETKHDALTKAVRNSTIEPLGSVSGAEKGKVESIPLESRFLCVYYLGDLDMNTDIDKSDCIVNQTEGSEVGKRSVGLVGSKDPADADASAPSPEAGQRAEGGGGGWAMVTRRKSKAASAASTSPSLQRQRRFSRRLAS